MKQQAQSLYPNITLNDVQLAAIYYPILIELARNKRCISYGELISRAKELHPNTEYVQRAIPVSTGRKLDVVRLFISESGLPDVTSLILNKSMGECGNGVTEHFDPIKQRKEVFAYDWTMIFDKFDLYIKAAEEKVKTVKASSKKATETISRQYAMAMTVQYYKENKAKFPSSITKRRDDIIDLILNDYEVEKAYNLVKSSL